MKLRFATAAHTIMTIDVKNILVIACSQQDARCIERAMERGTAERCAMHRETQLKDALAVLERGGFDVVVADLSGPDGGEEAVRTLVPALGTAALIALVGADDEPLALDAIRAGAHEVLGRDRLDAHRFRQAVDAATARCRRELALQDGQARLRDFAAAASEWFWETDAEHRFTYLSRDVARIVGVVPAGVIGRRPEDLAGDRHSDAWNRWHAAREARRAFRDVDIAAPQPDGSRRLIRISGTPCFDRRGDFRGYRGVGIDFHERCKVEERTVPAALLDTLTGLRNRVYIDDVLPRIAAEAEKRGEALAVLYLDLDGFKTVNETLGHASGDALLCTVATRLESTVRTDDIVVRLGGDEFVVIARGLMSVADVQPLAERILGTLAAPVVVTGQPVRISASAGIAMFPDDGRSPAILLKNADMAMYAAKAAGRNTFRRFTPTMAKAAERRLGLERALHEAIEKQQFVLEYQPIVCATNGRPCGVEALVRWQHPDRGRILPAEFIPFAEESGQIEAIGAWVLNEACRAIAGWNAAALGPLHVAVNVGAAQVNRGNLAAVVDGLTREHGIDPSLLEIEVTETAVIGDADQAHATLNRLRSLGVAVALDDFGTGYSSLLYLRRLDIDIIKIDRSFLENIRPGNRNGELVTQIIQLAKTLDLSVIAEGVETAEQAAFLKGAGCDMMQGYHVARPMPLSELQSWFAAQHACTNASEVPHACSGHELCSRNRLRASLVPDWVRPMAALPAEAG